MRLARAPLTVSLVAAMASAAPAWAQAPAPPPAEKVEEKKEEKAKTLWEENTLFAYIENSYVWNLGNTSRGRVNDLRYYDFDAGYTFNIAEFSIKKDPSERYPFGYGLVLTAGIPGTSNDSQKNHALGIFRGDEILNTGADHTFERTPQHGGKLLVGEEDQTIDRKG